MKKFLFIAASILLAAPSFAGEIKTEGRGCWTGESQTFGTSDKDFAFAWVLKGTYVDKLSADESSSYHCHGMGAVVGGKPTGNTWWCLFRYSDGSTTLSKGKAEPDGTTSGGIVSGTGRHEGATGSWTGSQLMRVGKPPQGQFAACRDFKGTKTLK